MNAVKATEAAATWGGLAIVSVNLCGDYDHAKLYARMAWTAAVRATIADIPVKAWTGGSSPEGPMCREELALWHHLFLEQCAVWRDYWHEEPPKDVRQTFSNRARGDAFATFRAMGVYA